MLKPQAVDAVEIDPKPEPIEVVLYRMIDNALIYYDRVRKKLLSGNHAKQYENLKVLKI